MHSSASSMEYLVSRYPEVGVSFRDGVRKAVDGAGPLSAVERELVMVGAYTAARQPRAFKLHCRRALSAGAAAEQVRHAVLLTLGASATLEMVVDALRWTDEVLADEGRDD